MYSLLHRSGCERLKAGLSGIARRHERRRGEKTDSFLMRAAEGVALSDVSLARSTNAARESSDCLRRADALDGDNGRHPVAVVPCPNNRLVALEIQSDRGRAVPD